MIKVIVFECGRCGGIHEWETTKYCNSKAVRYQNVEEFCEKNGFQEEDVAVICFEREGRHDVSLLR